MFTLSWRPVPPKSALPLATDRLHGPLRVLPRAALMGCTYCLDIRLLGPPQYGLARHVHAGVRHSC